MGYKIGGKKINITLKEMINVSKKYDNENNVTTEIKVFITSNDYEDKKRHTIVIDPESDAFYDRIAMITFDDCNISDINRHIINDREHFMTVFIDIDDQ